MPNSNNYYFFLSYARDMAGEDVEQLFKDLSKEVCDRAGLSPGSEVGFLDRRSIEWGSSWPRKLITALSQCKTFIALCTPRYFRSEACGKEWWVFEERLRRYEHDRGGNVPMLIPLLWLPTRVMPERARSRQFDNGRLDPAYHQDGLRQLIRLRQLRDAYIQAISLLAQHIVDQAHAHALPWHSGHMEFSSIPSAFTDSDVVGCGVGGAEAIPATSRYVHFVVAAPNKHEVSASKIREDLTFYGETRPEWAPYRPKTDQPLTADSALHKAIAEAARTVAGEQSFECGIASIDDLHQRIELAKQNNQLVVFLVDAWATMLTEHRRALVECDSLDSGESEAPTPAVMVPSSSDDEETRRHWQRLSNELRKVFVNRFAHGDDRMFRTSVLSLDAFEADLRVALKVAQNRMYVLGTPRNDVPGNTGLQPMLDLPDSASDPMG